MAKTLSLIFLLALTACSGAPPRLYASSPCSASPSGYECQILQYQTAP